jgi:hypothetical protein
VTVRVIDFRRFEWRPAITDFCPPAAGQWQSKPELELAFFSGYGEDPREPEQWRASILCTTPFRPWCGRIGRWRADRSTHGHHIFTEVLTLF